MPIYPWARRPCSPKRWPAWRKSYFCTHNSEHRVYGHPTSFHSNPSTISPTDKLMTPVTAKLSQAKKKHFTKSADMNQLIDVPF